MPSRATRFRPFFRDKIRFSHFTVKPGSNSSSSDFLYKLFFFPLTSLLNVMLLLSFIPLLGVYDNVVLPHISQRGNNISTTSGPRGLPRSLAECCEKKEKLLLFPPPSLPPLRNHGICKWGPLLPFRPCFKTPPTPTPTSLMAPFQPLSLLFSLVASNMYQSLSLNAGKRNSSLSNRGINGESHDYYYLLPCQRFKATFSEFVILNVTNLMIFNEKC